MKNKIQSSFALLSAVAIFTAAFLTSAGFPVNEPQPELAIGAKAPLADAAMANVDGTMMTLESAAGPNGLLVVFSCNTCPFVVGNGSKSDGWEGRYNATNEAAQRMGVGMVLVNSNEAKRDNHDSMEAMQEQIRSVADALMGSSDDRLAAMGTALSDALSAHVMSTQTILEMFKVDKNAAMAASFDYMMQNGYLFG